MLVRPVERTGTLSVPGPRGAGHVAGADARRLRGQDVRADGRAHVDGCFHRLQLRVGLNGNSGGPRSHRGSGAVGYRWQFETPIPATGCGGADCRPILRTVEMSVLSVPNPFARLRVTQARRARRGRRRRPRPGCTVAIGARSSAARTAGRSWASTCPSRPAPRSRRSVVEDRRARCRVQRVPDPEVGLDPQSVEAGPRPLSRQS